jgi:hypothetical protein
MPEPKKRGAQPNNTNALKHGLYSHALSHAGQVQLEKAREMDATDLIEEIALCRARIAAQLEANPDNFAQWAECVRALVRVVTVQFMMRGTAADRLMAAGEDVIEDMRALLVISV